MSNEHHYPYYHHPENAHGGQTPTIAYGACPYYGMPVQGGGVDAPMHTGGGGYGVAPVTPHYGQAVHYPYAQQQESSFFNFTSDRFLKGLLIGAAATYLITNESVQKATIKSVVKVWSMLQGGVEEIKERFHDAEAEIQAAEAAKE